MISVIAQSQASNAGVTGPSLTGDVAFTIAAGDIIEVQALIQATQTVTVTDTSSTGNSFSVQGTPLVQSSQQLNTFVCTAPATGTYTVEVTSGGNNVYAFLAKQIRGAASSGTVVGISSAFQAGPGSGANAIASGNVALGASPINALLSGFCINLQSGGIATAGTSPLAYTGDTAVWATYGSGTACCLPEHLRVASTTGNVQATFGGSAVQFNNIMSVLVAYLEAAATGGIQPAAGSLSLAGVAGRIGIGLTPHTAKVRDTVKRLTRKYFIPNLAKPSFAF
jgi:hypothetical protein